MVTVMFAAPIAKKQLISVTVWTQIQRGAGGISRNPIMENDEAAFE